MQDHLEVVVFLVVVLGPGSTIELELPVVSFNHSSIAATMVPAAGTNNHDSGHAAGRRVCALQLGRHGRRRCAVAEECRRQLFRHGVLLERAQLARLLGG